MVKYMNMDIKKEDLCPCNSGKAYGECCETILNGGKQAETAEALMRARYTAYVVGDIEFLKKSSAPAVLAQFDEESAKTWSASAEWHGLEIVKTELGGIDDKTGKVEFRARYSANGEFYDHHELSTFVKDAEGWKFEDGEMLAETPIVRETPKINRNALCPCGSGKKYKKCCGK